MQMSWWRLGRIWCGVGWLQKPPDRSPSPRVVRSERAQAGDAPGMNDEDAASLLARLLCDIMIPAELSEALRLWGYDVIEAQALSLELQQDDWAILTEAARQERIVVTCNYSDPASNFCLIHAEWQTHGKEHVGIVLIPQFQIRG